MGNTKIQTISQLFEEKEIRSVWDKDKEDYYFSVVDVIDALTDGGYDKSRNYWKWLKSKLIEEGSELVSLTNQLKMKAKNEKPIGLSENRKVAKRGGKVAKKTKDFYEETTGLKAITKDNSLNYKYNNILEEAFKNYDGPNLAKEFEWDEPRGKEVW